MPKTHDLNILNLITNSKKSTPKYQNILYLKKKMEYDVSIKFYSEKIENF